MYISCVPRAFTFMSTTNSCACPNGMLSGRNVGGGIRCWFGAWVSLGSHWSFWMIAVERSQMASEIALHSYGHGIPPKVRRSAMRPTSSSGS
jgi:hypothetical protein